MAFKEFINKDVIIGSASIPGILIVLAFILFLIWMMILAIYFYSKHARFSRRLDKPVNVQPLKKLKPLKERVDLRHYLGKIDTLALKAEDQNPRKYVDELYHLVREFTIELLGIGHTYSDDELITILSGNSKDLARFYWHILEMRRHVDTLTNEKMETLMSHFFTLVNAHTKKKPSNIIFIKGFFDKAKGLFRKELSEEENKIEELLTKERRIFETNLIEVKGTYKKIITLYSKLPYDEKQKMYPDLLEFSHKLSDSLTSSVYGAKAKEELAFFPIELVKIRDINPQGIMSKVSRFLKEEPKLSSHEQEIMQALQPKLKPSKPLPAPKPAKEGKPLLPPKPLPLTKETKEEQRLIEALKKLDAHPVKMPQGHKQPEPVRNKEEQRLRNVLKELEEENKKPLTPVKAKPVVNILPSKPLPAPMPSKQLIAIQELTKIRIKKIDHITRIYRLIEKSRKQWMKRQLKQAKATYETIKHNFVLLDEEEKKEVYPAINNLYNDLIRSVPRNIPKKSIKEDFDAEENRLRMLMQKRMNAL